MKTLRIAIAALLVLVVAALAGIGRPEAAESAGEAAREGITVNGVGRVSTVPDEAEFSLGVTTEGTTARRALAANSERMRALIGALKAAGVADRDIQTRDVSVGSDWDADGRSDDFVASNTVSVLIRDLDRAGSVLDAATRAGATNVYGPSLTRANRDDLEAKALEDALANARKRAEALAAAAGVRLGAVTAISETGAAIPGPMEFRALDAAATAPPIEKGTQEIQATVSVTFAIE
ncbi:MAG TPA: SIMPL domain-containing protein [Gaiellaceae bacterium]|jgi:hypothetical protein|nr:SIMPL domain-containing protein [Gaiellaceae bacterium]